MESYDPKSQGMPESMGEKFEKKFEGIEPPITEAELRAECEAYPELVRLIDDMLDYSARYVEDVWKMDAMIQRRDEYTSTEEWQQAWSKVDGDRSRLHNTLIDSIAILSRNMNERELDIEWVRALAPAGTLERSYCGRFAIMLMFQRYRNFKLSS